MWELYDTLMEGMDGTETVEDYLIGPRWAAVLGSSGAAGIAPVIVEKNDRFDFSYQPVKGMLLKEIASYLRSWNLMEASLAMAAVNAFYNRPEKTSGSDELSSSSVTRRVLPGGRRVRQSFRTFCEENTAEGLTVLVEPVYGQDELAEMPGRMSVLKKETEFRDYYYTAYRELIPESDRLVLGGISFVEKTAEPMIAHALENEKEVLLFGPDVPLYPRLKEQGVRSIWGFVVDKPEALMQAARVNMHRDQFLRMGHFEVLDCFGRDV